MIDSIHQNMRPIYDFIAFTSLPITSILADKGKKTVSDGYRLISFMRPFALLALAALATLPLERGLKGVGPGIRRFAFSNSSSPNLRLESVNPPPLPFDIEKRRRLVGVLDGGVAGARRVSPPAGRANQTMEPIEPPWQAIKEWIAAAPLWPCRLQDPPPDLGSSAAA